MPPLTVTLFTDFAEDQRISMDRYADGLARALTSTSSEELRIRSIRPVIGDMLRRAPVPAGMRIRIARYVSYPRQAAAVPQEPGSVNHIVDHGYAHLLGSLDPARTVVTVHDLIPTLAWKGLIPGHPPGRRPVLGQYSLRFLRQAAAVLAVSQTTRADLVAHCGVDPRRIAVVHNGLDEGFRPADPGARALVRGRHGWHDDLAVILITGRQFYKNHRAALEAVRVLESRSTRPIALVRLGDDYPGWDDLQRSYPLRRPVQLLGGIGDAELPGIYGAVDCLCFPSNYEGFGWPPLEAMACGTPVVCSRAGALPEVVGDAALVVDANDSEGLAEVMLRILEQPQLAAELRRRGLARAAQFTWQRSATQVIATYRRIIGAESAT